MNVYLDNTIDSYRTFLRIKELPRYEIHGRMAVVPDEYAATLGLSRRRPPYGEHRLRPRRPVRRLTSRSMTENVA